MTKNQKQIISFGGFLLLFLMLTKKAGSTGLNNILNTAKKFIQGNEGFLPYPVWDYKQWSWGYGTKVPGSTNDKNKNPGGTITKEKAANEAARIMIDHYNYLSKLIYRNLNANQWAALLSFSFNLGIYNADNLVKNINDNNDTALFGQWIQYVNAGGVPNEGLVKRRQREINLWKQ